MKWFIASDIHGSAAWCERLLRRYAEEGADRLVLLGDILYHGPRNDLPEGYAPKEVIAQLSPLKDRILCVRGNCEAEVDQMVLPFPVLADYALLAEETRLVYLTHGHIHNAQNLPPISAGDVLLHGHTHVPCCETVQGIHVLNPGSVSIPKENSWHGYMTLENGVFVWKDVETGEEKMRFAWAGCGSNPNPPLD